MAMLKPGSPGDLTNGSEFKMNDLIVAIQTNSIVIIKSCLDVTDPVDQQDLLQVRGFITRKYDVTKAAAITGNIEIFDLVVDYRYHANGTNWPVCGETFSQVSKTLNRAFIKHVYEKAFVGYNQIDIKRRFIDGLKSVRTGIVDDVCLPTFNWINSSSFPN
jgi:hypothetical protein